MPRTEFHELDDLVSALIERSDADPITPSKVANECLHAADPDIRGGWILRQAAFGLFKIRATELLAAEANTRS